jgi:molybdopterin-guanine dinucleotide biosynthesis protein A
VKAAVVLIAGGEATRLPEKLTRDAGGVPLIVRTYRGFARERECFVSCKGTFGREIDAALDAPYVVDRWPRRGPLAGLVSTLARVRSRFVVAIAADAPLLGEKYVERLERELRDGDEAVVPVHGTGAERRLEPLAALYDRVAFLRESIAVLRGDASVLAVVQRLRARTVAIEPGALFRSINTPSDYAVLLSSLEER